MDQLRNISIAVYEKNKSEIDNSSNASEKFIIYTNEELSNKNREYIVEIDNLKNQNDILEEQNDKLENSTRYMRGILHNFTEKVKKQDKLIKYYKKYHTSLKDYTKPINGLIKKTNEFIRKFAFIYNVLLLTLCLTIEMSIFSIIFYNIIVLVSVAITVAVTQIDYNLIKTIEGKTQSINQIQKQEKQLIDVEESKIAEIDKSNNFIEDYIDMI